MRDTRERWINAERDDSERGKGSRRRWVETVMVGASGESKLATRTRTPLPLLLSVSLADSYRSKVKRPQKRTSETGEATLNWNGKSLNRCVVVRFCREGTRIPTEQSLSTVRWGSEMKITSRCTMDSGEGLKLGSDFGCVLVWISSNQARILSIRVKTIRLV